LEENKINTDEEVIIEQMTEQPALDNPALSYKKNLVRLMILSGLGLTALFLLIISFYLVVIKL